MPDRTGESARAHLGSMLRDLKQASGLGPNQIVKACAEHSLSRSTLRNWLSGTSAPAATPEKEDVFWCLVRELQAAAGLPRLRSDDEWKSALHAAQREGARNGGRNAFPQHQKPGLRPFVRAHLPELRAQEGLVGRRGERTAMHAFVRASGPKAPSYLCWRAESAVGKTALLADYVKRPPPNTDVLSFFVSEAHGTHTRAAFTVEMGEQIRAFLGPNKPAGSAPGTPQGWAKLFGKAAAKSAGHGRKLLLVVDGIDEDMVWAGPGPRAAGRSEEGRAHGTGRGGSIAALLPSRPGLHVRVIVSTRHDRVPDDVPAGHPLRLRTCFRELKPLTQSTEDGQAPRTGADRLRASDPGRTVVDLLAVTGESLRAVDLAELAQVHVEQIDHLVHSKDARGVLVDDPVTRTYALGSADLVRSVRQGLGPAGVAHRAALLHAWADTWRAAGWPEGTPPYLLTGYLQLLEIPMHREEYVLDARRQARLAAMAGHDVALAQLDAYEVELGTGGVSPERLGAVVVSPGRSGTAVTNPAPLGAAVASPASLGVAVRLAASRALLVGRARRVPPGASVLFARLGDVARARALARLAPGPLLRAVALAQVAVEVGRAGLEGAEGADPIAEEAAGWASRVDRVFPRPAQDTDAYAQIAEAAHGLRALGRTGPARALLRVVVLSGAADLKTVVGAAAAVLAEDADPRWVEAVEARADDLSAGGPRAQAAAVETWGSVAHRLPSRHAAMRERILALCEELDPSDGLATVDVLALAASALAERTKVAPKLARTALKRLSAALDDHDSLSPADQAHLQREVSSTLPRLSRAVDISPFRDDLVELKELVTAHRDRLRIGVLGDDLAERGQAEIAAGEERRDAEDAANREKEEQRRKAARREKDAENRARAAENERVRRTFRGLPAAPSKPIAKRKPSRGRTRTADRPDVRGDQPEYEDRLPEHVTLLRQAERWFGGGNTQLARELLEEALRCSPLPPEEPAGLGADWTPSLAQALGEVGKFEQAERLAGAVLDPEGRVRHLADLALGCSQGGYGVEARRYAGEAARLGGNAHDPVVRGLVAQALAHAGEAADAVETAERRRPQGEESEGEESVVPAARTQIRQAVTAVAAGLARRDPGAAARLVEPEVAKLRQRIGNGSPLNPLPQLAGLLLAFPDVRRPSPHLREAIRLASAFVDEPRQQWRPQPVVVRALLEVLGCCPGPEPYRLIGAIDAWQRALPPDQVPHAELALLKAVQGDVAAARRVAEEAPTAGGRAVALAAVARHLAGVPAVLSVDRAAEDSTLRLCRTLAHAAGDGTAPDKAAARLLVHEMLASEEAWTHAIPLLPRLAPEALVPLAELARAHGPESAGGGRRSA
ncbi:hypothetical protein [Streptomyces sp. NPDC059452]|uniref:hypothetical protein n=1 Tax=Streptomyces sp. NPDC059452 TaxID=3346835 RepID=UPI0036AF327D